MKIWRKLTGVFLIASLVILPACREKTPQEKLKTYDGVELTYYKMFDDSDVIEPIISEYEAAHPGLKINYRKFDNFDEYQKVVLNEMAEGEGPDIFSMQNNWFFSNYKKLSPMPESFGTPDDFASTFVDVAYKDLVRTDQNGYEQVYALPMTVDSLALYYNKAHFEDRLPDTGRPASTWEGIKEDVVKLNKEDNSFERFEVAGIAMGRSDNISRGVDILYLLFLQYGVDFYNEDVSEAIFAGQQGGITTYPAVESLDLFTSFADENQKHYSWNEVVIDDDASEKEVEAFAKGKVSMIAGFAYTYDDVIKQINIFKSKGVDTIDLKDIKIAPIPQIYDPKVSTDKRVTYANYFAEGVSRNSKHPEVAWDFLLELTKKKNLETYFEKTHKPTSRRDMIDAQRKDALFGVFAMQSGFAESFPILDYYVYKDIFSQVIANANLGTAERSDLVTAQDLITAMLPKNGLVIKKKEKLVEEEAE